MRYPLKLSAGVALTVEATAQAEHVGEPAEEATAEPAWSNALLMLEHRSQNHEPSGTCSSGGRIVKHRVLRSWEYRRYSLERAQRCV